MKRVFLVVLDSVGAGYLPDAAKYGDVGANTLGHIIEQKNPALPNMYNMGLGLLPGLGARAPAHQERGCRCGGGLQGRAPVDSV